MIVRAQEDQLVLIAQHDHAQMAGLLARNWGNDHIPPPAQPAQALLLATALHDVGWIALDRQPLWNPAAAQPHSFIDEPLLRKLPRYSAGIAQVEQQDAYAGLLCSRHYESFFPAEQQARLGHADAEFVAAERTRQQRLRSTLRRDGRGVELEREEIDLGLLKLWDDLSLYAALNVPGADKPSEHPWYRDGFRPTQLRAHEQSPPAAASPLALELRLAARWLDARRIALNPFPFRVPLIAELPYRRLARAGLDADNFALRLRRARKRTQQIEFVPEPGAN